MLDLPLFLALLLALLLDRLLGEPRRWHPLVGYGLLVRRIEHWLYADSRARGALALLLALTPAALLLPLYLLPGAALVQHWLLVPILYLAVGARALRQHAEAVETALGQENLELARTRTGYMVSRQTQTLDAAALRRATIESVLENGNDTLFGALFWAMVAGAPGVVLYRLANTLDAMWGYRNTRYARFGTCAARLDDLLNWVPARLTALSYALLGLTGSAVRAWRSEAHLLASPNGGPVMCAGAGALDLRLGGPACYHGHWHDKPWFGGQSDPEPGAINRACRLVEHSGWLWLAALGIGQCCYWLLMDSF